MMYKVVIRGLNLLQQRKYATFLKRVLLFLIRQFKIGRKLLCWYSMGEITERMENETGSLESILDTLFIETPGVYPYHLTISQIREEIEILAEKTYALKPETIVEIGTKNGGTLYVWSRYFNQARQIVSVDLPGGKFGGGYPKTKQQIYRQFSEEAEMDFLLADSHDKTTLQEVHHLIDNPVDFLFIDADHTYEGVKQDFEMYSGLVRDGGIVAFHDIVHHPNHPDCNVDIFWNEIKSEYEHEELVSSVNQEWAGIGILYI